MSIFDNDYIQEIVEQTVPFPFMLTNEIGEVTSITMVNEIEGVDVNGMPMVLELETETEHSSTFATYQLVSSTKEFKNNNIPQEN